MITESVSQHRDALRGGALASGALAADLAADAADLLDVSSALGVEFRKVVGALLRAPERPAPEVVYSLAALAPRARRVPPAGEAPPFVWVRLISGGRRGTVTVRAGWLVPAAVQLIATEARAAGANTEVHVIVPLDSGDAAVGRIRALCAGLAPDLKLTIDVQGEQPARGRGGRWRPSGRGSRDGARPAPGGFRAGTWVVFGPLGATT